MRDEPGKEQRYSFQSIHFILFKSRNFQTSNTIVVLISTHIDVVVNLKLIDAPSSIFSVTQCTVMFYYSICIYLCSTNQNCNNPTLSFLHFLSFYLLLYNPRLYYFPSLLHWKWVLGFQCVGDAS